MFSSCCEWKEWWINRRWRVWTKGKSTSIELVCPYIFLAAPFEAFQLSCTLLCNENDETLVLYSSKYNTVVPVIQTKYFGAVWTALSYSCLDWWEASWYSTTQVYSVEILLDHIFYFGQSKRQEKFSITCIRFLVTVLCHGRQVGDVETEGKRSKGIEPCLTSSAIDRTGQAYEQIVFCRSDRFGTS